MMLNPKQKTFKLKNDLDRIINVESVLNKELLFNVKVVHSHTILLVLGLMPIVAF